MLMSMNLKNKQTLNSEINNEKTLNLTLNLKWSDSKRLSDIVECFQW